MHSAPHDRNADDQRSDSLWPHASNRALADVHRLDVSSLSEPSSAIFDTTEDVQISLGIQRSLGNVWTRGVQWVGSLSLAWQDEYSVETRVDAREPTETLGVRPRSNAWSVNSTTRTVRSDEYAVRQSKALESHNVSDGECQKRRERRKKKRREQRMDKGGSSVDRKAGKRRERRIDKDGLNVDHRANGKKRRDRRKRGDKEAVDSGPDENKQGCLTKHRLSKRPSRLLVPASNLHVSTDNPNALPQLTRHQHIDSSHTLSGTTVSAQHPRSPPTHRRTKSMPIAHTLHKLPAFRQTASTMTSATPLTEEQYMVQLEDQVSDMFVELGLRSPYMSSQTRCLPTDTSCLCEAPLWFLSNEYESAKTCEHGKYIILMDDDSSYSE